MHNRANRGGIYQTALTDNVEIEPYRSMITMPLEDCTD